MSETVSFGDELKDGFKTVEAWTHLSDKWLEDIQTFYRERSLIEKEYSQKLSALTAKFFDKKAKLSAALSVGESPKITPGSLENASLVTWNQILTQTEAIARERQRLSSEFGIQIADQVHGIQLKLEDVRKRYNTCYTKVVESRDHVYSDVKKRKEKYDSACQKMEDIRLKNSKSESGRTQSKLSDREISMHETKNAYLLQINVANRVKDKFYHVDVPEILDGLQGVNEARVSLLNAFWKQAITLESDCDKRILEDLGTMQSAVAQNKPVLGSAMFVRHNVDQGWTEPADFVYEPSPIWHEDSEMAVDQPSLMWLRRKLADASNDLTTYAAECDIKLAKYKELGDQKSKTSGMTGTNLCLLLGQHVLCMEDLTLADTNRLMQAVQIEAIESATSDQDLGSVPLAPEKKKGLFGRGLSVRGHKSNGSVSSRGLGGSTKQGGGFSVSSLLGRRHGEKTGDGSKGSGGGGASNAQVLYDYTAQGDDEASITAGQTVSVIKDDGSGWTEISSGSERGLVPTSYIQIIASSSAGAGSADPFEDKGKVKGPAVAPKRGAKKVSYMIALYDYDAQAPDELTIRQGDKILVVQEDSGDGWTQGELNAMSGSFPTSYAKSS